MLNSIRALLFDLDGVLVDSRVPIARSMNFALARSGVPPFAETELHRYIGPPLREAFLALLARRGAAASLADRCVEAYRQRYRWASLEETVVVEGVAESVGRIGARYRLAVATSKPVDFARPILESLGLASSFECVVGPALDAKAEPKSATVRRALAELELPRSAGVPLAAIVGDRHHDVEAGRANGLFTIGVTWGIGDREELRRAGADMLVDTPAQLAALAAGNAG